MTTSIERTVWCDAPDCPNWEQMSAATVRFLRREAAQQGWSHVDGKDYCPKHRPKGTRKPRPRPLPPGVRAVSPSQIAKEQPMKAGRR